MAAGGGKAAAQGQERAAARKAEVAAMVEGYGLTWAIGAPPLDACPAMPDGRPATVKKMAVDRLDAPGGSPVDTLEKGDRVFVMEESGGMARVQLLDGSEGWVPVKQLK